MITLLFLLVNFKINWLVFLGASGSIIKDAYIGNIVVLTLCMDYLGLLDICTTN